jgi:hypothetical protein
VELYKIITDNKPAQTNDQMKDLFEITKNLEVITWNSTILKQTQANDDFF